jgi:hypothetical protein
VLTPGPAADSSHSQSCCGQEGQHFASFQHIAAVAERASTGQLGSNRVDECKHSHRTQVFQLVREAIHRGAKQRKLSPRLRCEPRCICAAVRMLRIAVLRMHAGLQI